MSPRVNFPIDAEGHSRFHELIGAVGMQFVEQRREEMPVFGYVPMLVVIHGELISQHGTYANCELRSGGGEHKFVFYIRGRSKALAAVLGDLERSLGQHLIDRHVNNTAS